MPAYDVIDQRFASMVLPNASLEVLGENFRWLEGPIWFADHDMLLFSDLPNNRVMRWSDSGIAIHRAPADYPNGHARDRQGRLIECAHSARCIRRVELDGTITTLASHYAGKRLNSPNDVIVKSDGSIWFSDPPYGISTDYEGGKQAQQLPATLYRLDPNGMLEIAAADFDGPNGLCFSPDETRLYAVESGIQFDPAPKRHIRVFDLAPDGKTLHGGDIFHKIDPGMADGIRADEAGNIWSSAGDGIHCIDPSGKLLGKILVPATVANIAFGGRDLSRLFICAGQTLYAIYTNVRGAKLL
jgi:gluconolactonase